MKKITSRAFVCIILAFLLILGSLFFVFRFFTKGGQWASYPSNKHLYSDGVLNCGRVLDQNGTVLASYDDGWHYAESESMRRAVLHAVGDPKGSIGSGAMSQFASKLTGYNPITGANTVFSGGRDLYLTIDADVCETAYKALNGKNGTVGVYNYETGEIICMVSSPGFDPADGIPEADSDDSGSDNSGMFINRLLSSKMTPGSTFKLITATAAIENIEDIDNWTFTCTGSTNVGNSGSTVITCVNAHGEVNFEEALTVSCNAAFAQLAIDMGKSVMEKYTKNTGLTSVYSINGISTTASSFDFDYDDEDGLAWSGVGQGRDLVNPCALMIFCGAVANGGKAAVPQIIDHTAFLEGSRTSIYIKRSTSELIKSETASKLCEMMKNNVKNNYGSDNFPGLEIAAKSGTAEVDTSKASNSWFTGFLDDSSHPLAFVVSVEEGGSGAKTAGGIANKVLQAAVEKGY